MIVFFMNETTEGACFNCNNAGSADCCVGLGQRINQSIHPFVLFCYLVTLKILNNLRALSMENPSASPTVNLTITSTTLPKITMKSNTLKDDLKKSKGPNTIILRTSSKMNRSKKICQEKNTIIFYQHNDIDQQFHSRRE